MRVPTSSALRRFMQAAIIVAIAALVASVLLVPRVSAKYSNDLILSGTLPSAVDRGNEFTFLLTLRNVGPTEVTNLRLAVAMSRGLQFVQSDSDVNCTVEGEGRTVRCRLSRLGGSAARDIALVFIAPKQDSCVDIVHNLSASAYADESDPSVGNNTTPTFSVFVRCTDRTRECSDGLDNDHDGYTDMNDVGCISIDGVTESNDDWELVRERALSRQRTRILAKLERYPNPFQSSSSSRRRSSSSSVVAERAGLNVTLSTSQSEARPGDRVQYTITLRNRSEHAVRGAKVDFDFPSSVLSVVTDVNGGSLISDGKYQWRVDIDANRTKTIRFTVAVSPNVKNGMRSESAVHVTNVPGYPSDGEKLYVLMKMPATGVDGGVVAVFWSMIASAGLTAGMIIGRKMFIVV